MIRCFYHKAETVQYLFFPEDNWHSVTTYWQWAVETFVTTLLLNCVCMMLAHFTQMIGILLNNFRDILFRSAVFNSAVFLLLLFRIWVNIVSSLHVATVETQRYAFLLFSLITTVSTRVFFPFRVSCLRHATSFAHGKLFFIKFIKCIKFSALFFKKQFSFISLRNEGLRQILLFCKVQKFSSFPTLNRRYVQAYMWY
jgi:hypothetical protein